MVSHDVQDEVIARSAFRKGLTGVIDHVIGADRSHQIHILLDQYFLTGLEATLVAKRLQCEALEIKPENITFEQAAAIPIAAVTANTSSPGLNRWTFLPTATTVPAKLEDTGGAITTIDDGLHALRALGQQFRRTIKGLGKFH